MKTPTLLLTASCLAAFASGAHAHDHFAAGIVDVNNNHQADAGEPLQFVGVNGTSKIFHLCPRPVGYRPIQRCGGYYMLDERPRTLFPLDAFSFITLSDGQYELAGENHAHTGAYIWMEIVSVKGPDGGEFGFWDENRSVSFDTPTVSFLANQPTANFAFVLSEGFDDPSEDPLGHIHGRSWTATKPGDYYVGMRLVDRSTSGPGGGPWHPPSAVYTYHFQAGPSFQTTSHYSPTTGYALTWGSLMGIDESDGSQVGIDFQIERATSLTPPNWQVIGTVTGTTAPTVSFTDPAPPVGSAFYRLKYLWSAPGAGALPAAIPPAAQAITTRNDGDNSKQARRVHRAKATKRQPSLSTLVRSRSN